METHLQNYLQELKKKNLFLLPFLQKNCFKKVVFEKNNNFSNQFPFPELTKKIVNTIPNSQQLRNFKNHTIRSFLTIIILYLSCDIAYFYTKKMNCFFSKIPKFVTHVFDYALFYIIIKSTFCFHSNTF